MDMMAAAGQAFFIVLDPMRMLILAMGVVIGLFVGIVPGLGGLVALAMLIPFTYALDAHSAFALLIGIGAVTTISDVIPAVLLGVPGTVASAATVLDGYPLSKQGRAGFALGAAYTSSLLGGIFGAILLAVSIPILRPVMLHLGSPELLMMSIFGLSMVASLSGRAPLKGLAVAAVGLIVAMIGSDPQTGTLRWTFHQLYLWDGLPIVPVTLGLFAVPELAELVIKRTKIARDDDQADRGFSLTGQVAGIKAAASNWWLVLRCSWIGAAFGAVPGMGSAVIDWIAYGHATRTEKNTENFGKGDVRGVIASESAANAKEGGALVPTIAFGVPGSASMALLLSAFMIHGLVPGPNMLGAKLDVTYAIIWSLVIAHMIGAAICMVASGQLMRIVYVRFGILVPIVLSFAFLGAFEGSKSWGDLWTLLIFGVIGWVLKELRWPRPPLILGVVLGPLFERYLFISIQRYGFDWVYRPIVLLILAVILLGLYRPIKGVVASAFANVGENRSRAFSFKPPMVFNLLVLAALAGALVLAQNWPTNAAIVPVTAVWAAIVFVALDLLMQAARPSGATAGPGDGPGGVEVPVETPAFADRTMLMRGFAYFGWLLGLILLAYVIGLPLALMVFVAVFMRIQGGEKWLTAVIAAVATGAVCLLVFNQLLNTAWPQALLGSWLPGLRSSFGIF